MNFAQLCAILIWFALIAYAIFGGADFGGGIWDLLAHGPRAKEQRAAITEALGPVWETNNVWLIFVLVGAWTTFPLVFSALSTALFIPLSIALAGIVLRGAAFVFRGHGSEAAGTSPVWGGVFSTASTITPFMLGACAAAIAGGNIHVRQGVLVNADYWQPWTTPFALCCGLFAVGLCSCLAATYLTVEARQADKADLVADFRTRAIIAGGISAVLGGLALILAWLESPYLWSGLTSRALPVALGAMAIGLLTAFLLLRGHYQLARLSLITEIVLIIVAWSIAQTPYLIVPDVTLAQAASSPAMLKAFFIASIIGLVFLLPSIGLLFYVFKGRNPAPDAHLAHQPTP